MTHLEVVKELVELGKKASYGIWGPYGFPGHTSESSQIGSVENTEPLAYTEREFTARVEDEGPYHPWRENRDFIVAAANARPALAELIYEVEMLRAETKGMHEGAEGIQ